MKIDEAIMYLQDEIDSDDRYLVPKAMQMGIIAMQDINKNRSCLLCKNNIGAWNGKCITCNKSYPFYHPNFEWSGEMMVETDNSTQLEGCEFCNKFNFDCAKPQADKYGARILIASELNSFSIDERFKYCPVCGKRIN